MSLNKIVAFTLLLFSSATTFAQTEWLNAQTADEIGLKPLEYILAKTEGPMPYERVQLNNVVYEKKVWEKIPLNEKANGVYYYPIVKTEDRRPLFDILKQAIESKDITEVFTDDTFKTRIDLRDLDSKFYKIDTTADGKDFLAYGMPIPKEYIVKTSLRAKDVSEYRIVGSWYLDRNQGEMKYRILGFAPVVIDINTVGTAYESEIELFWIFFPAARQTLFENAAYNEINPAMSISFDFLFNARRFSSVIYKTGSLAGNEDIDRSIRENSMMQLLEAERIKESIRNFEDDLWNY